MDDLSIERTADERTVTHTITIGTSLCILAVVLTVATPLGGKARAEIVHGSGETVEQPASPTAAPPTQEPGPLE